MTLLQAADDASYPMGAGTVGDSGAYTDCGIANAHAYSILTVFVMSNTNMVMLRNPWGTSTYSGNWHKDDTSWTDSKVNEVPFGIDPRTSDTDGIFVMTMADFIDTDSICLNDF